MKSDFRYKVVMIGRISSNVDGFIPFFYLTKLGSFTFSESFKSSSSREAR